MTISEHKPRGTADAPGPAGVLAEARARVGELADLLWSARADREVVEVVEEVQRLKATLAAVEATAVAEAEARDLARRTLHYGSTGDWLTHVGGLRRGEGRGLVRRALAVTGPLTRTRQRMVAGSVSPQQCDVVTTTLRQLPGAEHLRRRAEKRLLREAGRLDASELARAGRHLLTVVDPKGEERRLEAALERDERAAHVERFLAIADDGAGGVRIKGRGSLEDGAVIRAALLPLTIPRPAVDEGDGGGPVRDPRDHGARLFDALVTTCHQSLSTDTVPDSHGTAARLVVTTDHRALVRAVDHAGIGQTADGWDLPAAVVRRLACDAEIIPAVLGTHSEILDVGRSRRLVTGAMWTALVLRDRHCAFPGCTRPPVMCQAHHIRHWVDGGATRVDNLVLLCGHHHRTVHHTPWAIRISPKDRRPELSPPPRLGLKRTWIRYRPRSDE